MNASEHQSIGTAVPLSLSVGTWRISIERAAPKRIELAHMYDRSAWNWNATIRLMGFGRAYRNLFRNLAADRWMTGLRGGAKVLDAGVGTAALSVALAGVVEDSLEIHGIDIAHKMLSRARNNLHRLQHRGLTTLLRYGDIDCISYPDQSFDMVMSAHVLEHSREPLHAIKEMVRVARAGAPLLIVTTRSSPWSVLHGMRWRYRTVASERLLAMMREAGLQDVCRYRLGSGLSFPGFLSEAYVGRAAGREFSRATALPPL